MSYNWFSHMFEWVLYEKVFGPPHSCRATEKKLSYKIFGYILNCKLKLVSVLLAIVSGLLKNLLLGPFLLAKYVVWLLDCGGKQKVLASPSLIKMICHDAVVDDGKRKVMEAVLLLIPSAC